MWEETRQYFDYKELRIYLFIYWIEWIIPLQIYPKMNIKSISLSNWNKKKIEDAYFENRFFSAIF